MGKMLFVSTSGGSDCAVYKIENISKKKIYMGQSRFIGMRRSSHLQALKTGAHWCADMQNDWNNGDIFKFSIVEMFPKWVSDDYLSAKEKAYIEKYHANTKGYNKVIPKSQTCCKHSPDKYTISENKICKLLERLNKKEFTFLRIKIICDAFHCQPGDIIEFIDV